VAVITVRDLNPHIKSQFQCKDLELAVVGKGSVFTLGSFIFLMEGIVFEKKLFFGHDEKCTIFCIGIKHLCFGVSEAGSNPHSPVD